MERLKFLEKNILLSFQFGDIKAHGVVILTFFVSQPALFGAIKKLESGLLDLAIDNALTHDLDYEYISLFKEHILIGVPKENKVNERYLEYQIPAEVIRSDCCDYDALSKLPIDALKDVSVACGELMEFMKGIYQ